MDQNKKIQEMQILEQTLQNILMQKQAFQMELSETTSALKEIEKTKEPIYKIIGQLMIKKDFQEINKELEDKKKMLDLRLNTLEKQEKSLIEKSDKLREEIMKEIGKDKKE